MGFLQDKKILVTGLLSNRSIAYGIAKALAREGAALAFTYQNEKLKSRVVVDPNLETPGGNNRRFAAVAAE